ncbi:MAG: hypothetical protein CMN27_05265 [Salinisphaera sp.]|nr:hypothetical protein [Salinisphaera sp.]
MRARRSIELQRPFQEGQPQIVPITQTKSAELFGAGRLLAPLVSLSCGSKIETPGFRSAFICVDLRIILVGLGW